MIIDVPKQFDSRHKAWAKHVVRVDTSKDTGFAFCGRFLPMGGKADVSVGSYILVYDERGSMKNWDAHVTVFQVAEDGSLKETGVAAQVPHGVSWALYVRDALATLVGAEGK